MGHAARIALTMLVAAVLLLVVVPVLVLWVPVALFARAVRAIHDRLEPTATPWNELIEFDPALGWRTAPNISAAARATDSVFRFSTDDHGWRRAAPLETSDVVVLGDSFTFGFGVDDRAHFAALLARGRRGLRVTPMGAVAYNLVQELLLLERFGADLTGKLVVWMIYVGNDISENMAPHLGKYRVPFLRPADDPDHWVVETSHVRPEPWPWSTGDAIEAVAHAELCCDTLQTRRAFAATRDLLRRGREVCDRHGADLVVLGVPDALDFDVAVLRGLAPDPRSFDADRPTAQLRACCVDLGIDFFDLRPDLERRHYLPVDGHWNESGHRRVAAALRDIAWAHRRVGARRGESAADRDAALVARSIGRSER